VRNESVLTLYGNKLQKDSHDFRCLLQTSYLCCNIAKTNGNHLLDLNSPSSLPSSVVCIAFQNGTFISILVCSTP